MTQVQPFVKSPANNFEKTRLQAAILSCNNTCIYTKRCETIKLYKPFRQRVSTHRLETNKMQKPLEKVEIGSAFSSDLAACFAIILSIRVY